MSSLEARFFAKVEKSDACWLWTAATVNGYGRFGIAHGNMVSAHRWSYEHHVGPIPDGLELDHLCRVRNCVNPAHLEPVTHTTNMDRKPSPTHCPRDHPYTPENTYVYTLPAGRRPYRRCRACNAAKARARNAAKRREVAA